MKEYSDVFFLVIKILILLKLIMGDYDEKYF